MMAVMVSGPVPELVSVTAGEAALLSPMFTLPNATFVEDSATPGVVPVPVSGTVCGLFAASSPMLTLALLAPVDAGAKFTPKKQLLPALMLLAPNEHAGVAPPVGATRANSPALAPVSVMPAMLSAAVPVLVNCTFVAVLVVPTFWLKAVLVGARVAAGAVPLPDSGTVCGLPGTLSLTLTLAARAPAAVGAKLTPRAQLLPGAKLLAPVGHAGGVPTVGATKLKSPGFAPVLVMLVMFRVAVPELVICMLVVLAVVPTFWLPKGTLVGLNEAAGAGPPVVDEVRWKTVVPPTPLKSEITKK